MNKKEAANYMIIRVKGIEVLLAQKSNVYKIVVDGKIVVSMSAAMERVIVFDIFSYRWYDNGYNEDSVYYYIFERLSEYQIGKVDLGDMSKAIEKFKEDHKITERNSWYCKNNIQLYAMEDGVETIIEDMGTMLIPARTEKEIIGVVYHDPVNCMQEIYNCLGRVQYSYIPIIGPNGEKRKRKNIHQVAKAILNQHGLECNEHSVIIPPSEKRIDITSVVCNGIGGGIALFISLMLPYYWLGMLDFTYPVLFQYLLVSFVVIESVGLPAFLIYGAIKCDMLDADIASGVLKPYFYLLVGNVVVAFFIPFICVVVFYKSPF